VVAIFAVLRNSSVGLSVNVALVDTNELVNDPVPSTVSLPYVDGEFVPTPRFVPSKDKRLGLPVREDVVAAYKTPYWV